MNVREELLNLKEKIDKRSNSSRKSYLEKIKKSSHHSKEAKNNMGCSNFAHAFASCDKSQQKNALNGSKVIGIISAYNDMLSAHQPLKDYPDIIKKISRENNVISRVAAGVPAMCDGITQGQPGMELSLFSRDVIAMSTAIGFSHNVFDGGICLGVCDKIVPGLMIGALTFGHLPIVFIPAGPMHSGLSNKEKSENRNKFASGEIDRSALIVSEQKAYHSSGTCTFYGTANTNQLIMEIMGLHLPSSSFFPPDSIERKILIEESVRRLINLMNNDVKMGEMIDSKSWINAIVGLLASGGSTNLCIHLLAMANAGGYKILSEDIDELSKIIPIISNVYPNGTADVNQFHNSGGVAALINYLLDEGMLFDDVFTVLGKGLDSYRKKISITKDKIEWNEPATSIDQSIIRDCKNPFRKSGGIKFIKGNIGSGLIKTSALKNSLSTIKGPAKVFNSQEEVITAFENNNLNQDCIIVVRGQGPSANGMPELHKLTPIMSILQKKGFNIALITDGRMSGASGSFPAVIHISPEAKKNGNLAKIQNDDLIELNIKNGSLNLKVENKILEERLPDYVEQESNGLGRELFSSFRDSVSIVNEGASVFKND